MRILVWHWGRRGAGPRFATALARAFSRLPGTEGLLSLSAAAELPDVPSAPKSILTVPTYRSGAGLFPRLATSPWLLRKTRRGLAELRPDVAISAMPSALDFLMVRALNSEEIPFGVVIHDALRHPGDGMPLQFALQRRLMRQASVLFALSSVVAEQIRAAGLPRSNRLVVAFHPPFDFGAIPPVAPLDGRPLRLLFFGRLLRYKGLDLLATALTRVRPDRFIVRIVGRGPRSDALAALAALAFVKVENRWVREEEIPRVLGWADALVLPYREASQSGVAAAALAAGRMVVATNVGGLAEQLCAEPLASLVPPDPAALAACLERIAEHPVVARSADTSDARWMALAARMLPELTRLREDLRGRPMMLTPEAVPPHALTTRQ